MTNPTIPASSNASVETRHELTEAWNDLPESLRCHPGLKRLFAAIQQTPRGEVSRLATGRADTPDAEIVTLTLEDGKKAKVIRALDLKWIARVPNGTKLYAALPAAPGAAQGEVK